MNVKYIFLIFAYIIVALSNASASDKSNSPFEYISPVPDSKLVSKNTNIILRPGEIFNMTIDILPYRADIEGSVSGTHDYQIIISDDNKTIVLKPDIAFAPGEKVTVNLVRTSKTSDERVISAYSFDFTISPLTEKLLAGLNREENISSSYTTVESGQSALQDTGLALDEDVSLPSDFPALRISVLENPGEGCTFLAAKNYRMILDNRGQPIYYKKMLPIYLSDFKIQDGNRLTYYRGDSNYFYVMDSTYALIDSFACGNGYITDSHDFQLIGNGHALMIAYDTQIIDMSEIVPGGNTHCHVTGLIIQELDANKNVVFQWRSWDHYEITNATNTDFLAGAIDYVHGNSIELDSDGNLLVSSRHMDEVTKINRQTGDILWRLGGMKNDFLFIDDPRGFSRQHDVRRIPNGHITLFDNGNFQTPQFSRAVEYELDEDHKICRLVWQYHDTPDIFGQNGGNVQRLPNGNTLICWGGVAPINVTEVDSTGQKEFELKLGGDFSLDVYRAFRAPWQGKATAPYLMVETKDDCLHLIFNKFGDSSVVKYYIYAGTASRPTAIIDSTSNNYIDLHNLPGGVTYYFRVTAIDGHFNESPYSNEVTAISPGQFYLPGDVNMFSGDWPPAAIGADVTYLVNYFRSVPSSQACKLSGFWGSADINGDCLIVGSDVTRLVNYFRGLSSVSYCPGYRPAWLTPADLPGAKPAGWPACDQAVSSPNPPPGN